MNAPCTCWMTLPAWPAEGERVPNPLCPTHGEADLCLLPGTLKTNADNGLSAPPPSNPGTPEPWDSKAADAARYHVEEAIHVAWQRGFSKGYAAAVADAAAIRPPTGEVVERPEPAEKRNPVLALALKLWASFGSAA